jgi:hypothetical protein
VTRTIRNSNNRGPGWLLAVGSLAFTIFLDPFALYTPKQAEDTLMFFLLFTICMAVFSLVVWVVLVRPCVDVTEEYFLLRNPVRETAVPRAGLVLTRGLTMGFPKLTAVDGTSHVAWGAENDAQRFIDLALPAAEAPPPVLTRRRPLGRWFFVLAATWALYCLVGVILW